MYVRGARRFLTVAILIAGLNPHPVTAELYLLPRFDTALGYDSNRFAAPDSDGSPFLETAPGLELTAFLTETLELDGDLAYRRTDFTESGYSYTDSLSGSLGVGWIREALEARLTVGGGQFKDHALPWDDYTWWEIAPLFGYTDIRGNDYVLRGRVTELEYDSRQTLSGASQDGTTWGLAPEFRWPVAPYVAAWTYLFLESFTSNEATDEYTTVGLGAGIQTSEHPRWRIGAAAEWGSRDYPNDLAGVVEDRRDTPWHIRTWANYRATPWAEIMLEAGYNAYPSTVDDFDYDEFVIRAGLRLIHEWDLSALGMPGAPGR